MQLLRRLRALEDAMVCDVADLVAAESPTADVEATARCAQVAAELGKRLLGHEPAVETVGGRAHLLWGARPVRVLLLGHLDTVWPVGTVARWPFRRDDGVLSGPGVFDMKAGVVQALHALSLLADRDGVALLLNTDEEIGSPTSRALIESLASGCHAVLVLEPAGGRSVKVGRKGISRYVIHVAGRAAHAGVEPERGVNALLELAAQVLALRDLADPDAGTTVTPTLAHAGTTANTVPASAEVTVDVRATSVAEQSRVDDALRSLVATVPGASLAVTGGPHRPPFPAAMGRALLEPAERLALELGLGPLSAVTVGGGSDGNFTAALGIPTLDGLGPVGGGAHAEQEHVVVSSLAERGALVAALVDDLRRQRTPRKVIE